MYSEMNSAAQSASSLFIIPLIRDALMQMFLSFCLFTFPLSAYQGRSDSDVPIVSVYLYFSIFGASVFGESSIPRS